MKKERWTPTEPLSAVLPACQEGARTGGPNGADLDVCKGSSILRDAEVGESEQGEQSPLRFTYETHPSTLIARKPSPFAGRRWNSGLGRHRSKATRGSNLSAPTASMTEGARNLSEEGNTRWAPESSGSQRGSFTRRLPAHAAPSRKRRSSPLLPAGQTIGLAPGTERYGTSPARDGAERNGRRHGSSVFKIRKDFGDDADRDDSLARKRIDGSRACPRVGIVLQRSVFVIAAPRSTEASHPKWKSSFVWAGATPRGDNLGRRLVERRDGTPERFE